jgi:hypothetical protein
LSLETLALNKKNRVTLKSSSHRNILETERNMTITKLRFNSLGIHGREEEEETLNGSLVHTTFETSLILEFWKPVDRSAARFNRSDNGEIFLKSLSRGLG